MTRDQFFAWAEQVNEVTSRMRKLADAGAAPGADFWEEMLDRVAREALLEAGGISGASEDEKMVMLEDLVTI